jgi:hypothetical protein
MIGQWRRKSKESASAVKSIFRLIPLAGEALD